MKPRPYQEEFVRAVLRDLKDHQRILGVAATGAGKTIISSMIMDKARGRCLFLADAQELVRQNADKFFKFTGKEAAVEMADQKVELDSADLFSGSAPKIVVGTTQSLARRLDKYPPDYFSLIIVDEAHRNTLGAQAQSVLGHFESAKVLGVTATPFRSDRKKLGDFYEVISVNIGLERLIKEGYLSDIVIKSVPVDIDLSKVRTTAGDYNDKDLGEAIEPHLQAAADLLCEHARDRKTVVFLPLIDTSRKFTDALIERGVRAVHVDGKDRDNLSIFHEGGADVVCNASLLTTGWDHPETDCVFILRPTKSLALFQQMVGRGTRIAPGKKNLLLLDPLFLTDSHKIITPSRLLAKSEEEAEELDAKVRQMDLEISLLDAADEVESERKDRLEEELRAKAKRKARTVDAMEFALSIDCEDLVDYEPELGWELRPVTPKQKRILEGAGFDAEEVACAGRASKIIDLLFDRRERGLATPKQVRLLKKFRHPRPSLATFDEASEFLEARFSNNKQAA